MKRILFVVLAAAALSCNSNQRSSAREEDNTEQREPVAPSEPDTLSIHQDTTTSGGMNRQNQYDTLK